MRRKTVTILLAMGIVLLSGTAFAAPECRECEEVAKEKIPEKYLDEGLKLLPSGIAVWDLEEALSAFGHKDAKYLWVDTRPGSFLKLGTIKGAVNLVCDLQGIPIPEADAGNAISQEGLLAEMKKIAPDIHDVTVVFFCQGPKCHRSYNAALRSVREYGLGVDKVVWFRGGYPNLEKHILQDPKLKRRIKKYLQGKVAE